MLKKLHSPQLDLTELLRSHGYRATSGRLEILKVLSAEQKPLSSKEIFEKCSSKSLDAVTVYRALEAFVVSKIVQRVDLQHGHVDYELSLDGHHHHHIVCKKCGTMEDVESVDCDKLTKLVQRSSTQFSLIDDHSMELFGVCNACTS